MKNSGLIGALLVSCLSVCFAVQTRSMVHNHVTRAQEEVKQEYTAFITDLYEGGDVATLFAGHHDLFADQVTVTRCWSKVNLDVNTWIVRAIMQGPCDALGLTFFRMLQDYVDSCAHWRAEEGEAVRACYSIEETKIRTGAWTSRAGVRLQYVLDFSPEDNKICGIKFGEQFIEKDSSCGEIQLLSDWTPERAEPLRQFVTFQAK